MLEPTFPYFSVTVYFIVTAAIFALHMKYTGKVAGWLSKHNNNPFWLNLNKNINPILSYVLSIVCVFGTLYRIPALLPYRPYTLGAVVLIWTLLVLKHLFKTFNKAGPGRLFSISFLTTFALYGELVAFDKLPSLFELPHYLTTLPKLTKALLPLPFSLFLAALVYGGISRLVYEFVRKSNGVVVDFLYKLLRLPITISIVYFGTRETIATLPLSGTLQSVLISICSTITIFVWFLSFWKSVEPLLSILAKNHQEERYRRLYPLFTLLGKTLVLLFGIYWFVKAWGEDPTTLLASAGIAGIAIAYASQDTLGSLFAGITIISDAPFKLGDFLILEDGSKGIVTQIGFRSTRILTPENVEIVIPNSMMANSKIKNMSGGSIKFARVDCSAGVAYGTDVDQIRSILLNIGN